MPKVIIDKNKCEGKANCLVCPQNVFELKEPDPKSLTWLSRLRVRIHGGKQAFAVREEKCNGCGKCIEVCPEKAIKLIK